MAQTTYTSAIWRLFSDAPQDKRINQTGGVEEMNWGLNLPNPPGNSHTEFTDKAILSFRKRLRSRVAAAGGHFEH